jgi:class 3 adenylate cyclase
MPRLKLGLALTALMLLAVLSTAFIVHFSWMRTSSRNVETIVSSLSSRTSASVLRELETTFRASEGAVEIVRSILFQGAIKTTDEAKREFVFLSVLRSQPAISWVGFGFPDGRFFGAHALDDGKIEMVEIGGFADESARILRRDTYHPLPGDIFFERREFGTSAYVVPGAKWFRQARGKDGIAWSMVDILPSGFEPAAVASQRLQIYGRFEGVIMVSLNTRRISGFLDSLDIASFGTARIVNDQNTVIASTSDRQDSAVEAALKEAAQASGSLPGSLSGGGGAQYYVNATPLEFSGWRLLTAVPRAAFTAEIDRSTQRLVLVVIGLAALAAVTSALFANIFFARPIQKIAGELRHIENFALGEVRRISTWLRELDDLSAAMKRMAASLGAFGLYVPTEIVRTLIAQGVAPKPGGETREITVMFADLPGFTKMTEKYGADVASFLTQFLTLATEIIHREGGTVDKFIGDCIMGIWNAPQPADDHAMRACRAAIAIREAMHAVARPDGKTSGQRVRIGINTGSAFVGNIGSDERLSYTAIGDTVNIASRLESLGKELGTEITIGEATAAAVSGRVELRPLGSSPIRGREGKLDIFELAGISCAPEERRAAVQQP